MKFGNLPPEEIEKRHQDSIKALKQKDAERFAAWYQEKCDELYWKIGKCCAGCDHWNSAMANIGECRAAGIMSGDQVMRSMGITFSTMRFSPGLPWTKADHVCGMFQDNFDWTTLPSDYLERIKALRNGKIRGKP